MARAPDFWRADGALAWLLAPAGALYGAIAAHRLAKPAPRAALPAIVVGGLTAGGDGKTPLALALAAMLAERGEAPAFLTRGYGGRSDGAAPFIVSPDDPAEIVGDEPLLLARRALTIVGADRAAGARLARDKGTSVVILDDGFHSHGVAADLALLVVDADYGAGNGRCLPAGPLRAPLEAQIARADALVLIGEGAAGKALVSGAGKPVFMARIVAKPKAPLNGARVVAFAGIGRPEKFFRTLAQTGAEVLATRSFPDHHRYRPKEIAELSELAQRYGARLMTTEKDAVRLPAGGPAIDKLPIRCEIEDALGAELTESLQRARFSPSS